MKQRLNVKVCYVLRTPRIVQNFKQFMNSIDFNHTVEVIVKPFKKGRSKAQNNYYWMILGIIADETGNDPNNLHEVFKRNLLGYAEVVKLGRLTEKITRSTTQLDVIEFRDYVESIRSFVASELGIQTPDPLEFGYEELDH